MKKGWVLGFLALSLLIAIPGAQATLIYDNGSPDGNSGNEMTRWIQAEDFSFTTAQTVTDVRFWGIIDDYYAGEYTGSITWQIYSNSSGKPGTLLYSGSVVPSQTFYHDTYYGPSYQYDFSIGSYTLAAGTYWLGLHNGPLETTDSKNFYWESTGSNTTLIGKEDIAPFDGTWQDTPLDQDTQVRNEHAFQLYNNVPIPGAVWLLGSGLAGLGLWRGRKRFKA